MLFKGYAGIWVKCHKNTKVQIGRLIMKAHCYRLIIIAFNLPYKAALVYIESKRFDIIIKGNNF